MLREDDIDLRELVHELLEERGYTVIDVNRIDEMVEVCRRHSPCVALIDSTSPRAFDLWHLGPALADLGVPAVAFTAHGSAREQFERDPSGYIGVISKPFDADEFTHMVDSICWEEHHQVAS